MARKLAKLSVNRYKIDLAFFLKPSRYEGIEGLKTYQWVLKTNEQTTLILFPVFHRGNCCPGRRSPGALGPK